MDRSAKLRKLDDTRRKLPFASVSACSDWINEIRKDPSLLEVPAQGKHVQEGRDDLVLKFKTSFGPMLQTIKTVTTDGSSLDLFVAHPWAVLDTCISKSKRLRKLIDKQLALKPCTPDKPWNIILYSDEVTPGNTHSPQNDRKFQAVYWSFLEFGPWALSHEEYWFPLMTEYSSVVKGCSGGLSQVFASLLKLFFEPGGFNAAPSAGGILLESLSVRFVAELGVVLQDGGAHKAVWHSRDGSKMCMLCKNLFTTKSEICDSDGTALLTCSVCKLDDLVAETSDSLRNKARFLEYHRTAPNFDDLQQATGITYHPHMFLLDRYLDTYVDIVAVFMHDYMHAFWVDGVFNLMVYLLFESFWQQGRRTVYKTFGDYLMHWTWPDNAKVTATYMASIFSTERTKSNRKAKHIKCSASDCLNLMAPLNAFVHEVLLNLDACKAECNVFLQLLKVIELVKATSKKHVEPAILLAEIEDFLSEFYKTFGVERTTPKFHWLLHLPECLARMHELFAERFGYGWLQNCFVLERKHKVGKRYAEPRTNTTKMKSGGLLSEVLCQTLHDLSEAPELNGLVDAKDPSKSVRARILSALDLERHTQVKVARRSYHNNASFSTAGDFVIFTDSHTSILRAGFVQLHCELETIQVSIIRVYDLVSRNDDNYVVWSPANTSDEWMDTKFICDPVPCKLLPNGNIGCFMP